MLPSLLLLSASVVSMPVIISEVKATREAGHLRVEVRGDGGIDPETARTRIEEGSLYLFLGGTRVKADNRAWDLDAGVGQIRAHRHRTETELYVPLLGNGCSGPVELQGTATGMTALVGCDGATPVVAPARAAAKRAQPAVPVAVKEAEPVKETKETKAASPSLNALVALPTTDEAPVVKAASVLPVPEREPNSKVAATSKRTAGAVAAKSVEAEAAEPPKASDTPKALDVVAEAKAVTPVGAGTAGPTAGSSGGLSLGKLAMPVLLLSVVAVGAYLFTRRKRGVNGRQIEILESASLGPKRSLIVARIGDETLYLGASEAGITLLKSSGSPATTVASMGAPAASSNELDQSLTDALADVPEPKAPPTPIAAPASFRSIEGGLATLFGRGAAAVPARPEARFDDILEDSVEDQELRQKLAAGMSTRVR